MTTLNASQRIQIGEAVGDVAAVNALVAKLGVGSADFTIGTETSNAITVNVQLNDFLGNALTTRAAVQILVLADANGDALNSTNYTTIAAGTDGLVIETVADKVLQCVSEDDGDLDIVLTLSSGAATSYLAVVLGDGTLDISGAITHAA